MARNRNHKNTPKLPEGLTKKERERLQRELRFLGYRTLAGRVTYDELERMQEIKALLESKVEDGIQQT